MTPSRLILATGAGLLLATLPFWSYLPLGSVEPHADHAPRHGGQLAMVGDHHLEVVRRRGRVEVFVSNSVRRPLRPREAWLVFDGATTEPLRWRNHRLDGADRPGAREIEAVAVLPDGTRLATSFDFSEP